jgi:hypothetical protein
MSANRATELGPKNDPKTGPYITIFDASAPFHSQPVNVVAAFLARGYA